MFCIDYLEKSRTKTKQKLARVSLLWIWTLLSASWPISWLSFLSQEVGWCDFPSPLKPKTISFGHSCDVGTRKLLDGSAAWLNHQTRTHPTFWGLID